MSLSSLQINQIYQLIASDADFQQRLENATDVHQAINEIVAAASSKNIMVAPADLIGHLEGLALARDALSDEQLQNVAGGLQADASPATDAFAMLPVLKSIASSLISDARLKTNIRPLGCNIRGVPLYTWCYIGGQTEFTGPLAQDLLRDAKYSRAVWPTGKGWLAVNYAAIGVEVPDASAMRTEGWKAWAEASSLRSRSAGRVNRL